MAPNEVSLQVRGRGVRVYASQDALLASRGGTAVPEMTPVGDLRPGDFIGIPCGGSWPQAPAALPVLAPRPRYGSEKRIRLPSVMTTELAFLLGAYFAEGNTVRSTWTVVITNSVEDVLLRSQRAWRQVFDLNSRITRTPGRCMGLVASSKRLVEFMDMLQCGSRARHKRVPDVIAGGTREHTLAFLQGAALDAYVTHTQTSSKWAICLDSAGAINGLQDLVTRLGVANAQIPKYNRTYDKTFHELYAPGAQGQKLCRLVPFLEPDKQRRAEAYMAKRYGQSAADVIPGLDGPSLYAMVPAGKCGRNGRGTGRQALRHLCDPRTTRVTRASVIRAIAHGAEPPAWVERVLVQNIRFAPVTTIDEI